MGWLSDKWKDVKEGVSSGWESTKDAITDVTGVESLNTLIATGGLAMAPANLSGKGILGEAMMDTLGPLMGQQQMPMGGMQQMTGPLMGAAPANLTMGAGTAPAPQTSAPVNSASLFGQSGYQYGSGQPASAGLLQANPEAYQYSPLMSGMA